jgi:hypothetical protein
MSSIRGVRYIGEQKNLFKTGRADAKLSLAELAALQRCCELRYSVGN